MSESSDAPDSTKIPSGVRSPEGRFWVTAALFELSLGVVGVVVWTALGFELSRLPLLPREGAEWSSLAWGVAATVPLVAALIRCYPVTPRPLQPIREALTNQLLPLFRPLAVWQLALISAAAGLGEELLFRGLLQHGISAWIGPPWGITTGLLLASIVFGVCHFVNLAYAVITTLVGVYLGALFVLTGDLLAPVVTHGLYDFLALLYLTRIGIETKPAAH